MIDESNFSERLSSLREKKNVSAREMSLAIGQNDSYINRIENKKAFPSMQCFFYICEYLNITPKDFFDDSIKDSETINEILTLLKSLSPEQLDIIEKICREFSKQ